MSNIPQSQSLSPHIVALLIKDPLSGPDLRADEPASLKLYSHLRENFHYDVIYCHHLASISQYIFSRLHPAVFPAWLAFVTDPANIAYISPTSSFPALEDRPASSWAEWTLSLVPSTHAHFLPKERLAFWLNHPDKEVRIAAVRMLGPRSRAP